MSFVFLIPVQYLFAKIVIADLANEFSLYAKPTDRHAGIGNGASPDDNALAHIDHFAGHKDVRKLVHIAINCKRWYQIKARMPCSHDFQIFRIHRFVIRMMSS
jgi:hypothetical protein